MMHGGVVYPCVFLKIHKSYLMNSVRLLMRIKKGMVAINGLVTTHNFQMITQQDKTDN